MKGLQHPVPKWQYWFARKSILVRNGFQTGIGMKAIGLMEIRWAKANVALVMGANMSDMF